jgi:hypothetical protein
MPILYENKQINNAYNIKFLGLITDISLSWEVHMDELTSKFNKACYLIRSVELLMSLEVLKMIYFSYVHSIVSTHYRLDGMGIKSLVGARFSAPPSTAKVKERV